MEKQSYGQKKYDCWQEYCLTHPLCNTDALRPHFDWIFSQAYIIGKQEKKVDSFKIGDNVRIKETNRIGTIIEPYSNDVGYRVYFDDGDGGEDAEYSADQLELYKKTTESKDEEDTVIKGELTYEYFNSAHELTDFINIHDDGIKVVAITQADDYDRYTLFYRKCSC